MTLLASEWRSRPARVADGCLIRKRLVRANPDWLRGMNGGGTGTFVAFMLTPKLSCKVSEVNAAGLAL